MLHSQPYLPPLQLGLKLQAVAPFPSFELEVAAIPIALLQKLLL
jgi:hypothetical protein